MATLRAAPTQPKSPRCLKKEGTAKRGEMESLTSTTPSTKLQQLHKKKKKTDNTLTNGMQLTVRAIPKNRGASPGQFST